MSNFFLISSKIRCYFETNTNSILKIKKVKQFLISFCFHYWLIYLIVQSQKKCFPSDENKSTSIENGQFCVYY